MGAGQGRLVMTALMLALIAMEGPSAVAVSDSGVAERQSSTRVE